MAVSDILARKELSPELKGHLGLYVGCISGASLVGEYEGWLRGVGFQGMSSAVSLFSVSVFFVVVRRGNGVMSSADGV